MKELDAAKKVISIAKELADGVDTSRQEILERAGRARSLQIKQKVSELRESEFFRSRPAREVELHAEIIATLDQMSRRMPLPLPDNLTDKIAALIAELDEIRSSKSILPNSPGILIWQGEVDLRRHEFSVAAEKFDQAIEILLPLVGSSPSAAVTLVAALCEAAYSCAMLSDSDRAISYSNRALSTASDHKVTESALQRTLREYFIAGEEVTLPRAAAYLNACDIRINLSDDWDVESQLANDFNVYWNLLNDECGGLSALQVPHLIAILSDKNWMKLRSDLATPIARALYLRTSSGVPHVLWRRANLFFGGFRIGDGSRNERASGSAKIAATILIAALIGLGGADAMAHSIGEIGSLSSAEVSNYFGVSGKNIPSGSEILASVGSDFYQGADLRAVTNAFLSDLVREGASVLDFDVATANSSLVGSDLV